MLHLKKNKYNFQSFCALAIVNGTNWSRNQFHLSELTKIIERVLHSIVFLWKSKTEYLTRQVFLSDYNALKWPLHHLIFEPESKNYILQTICTNGNVKKINIWNHKSSQFYFHRTSPVPQCPHYMNNKIVRAAIGGTSPGVVFTSKNRSSPEGIDPGLLGIYAQKFNIKQIIYEFGNVGVFRSDNNSWDGNYGKVNSKFYTF